jgi:hypothetical protein
MRIVGLPPWTCRARLRCDIERGEPIPSSQVPSLELRPSQSRRENAK